jgi:hypothetical protein
MRRLTPLALLLALLLALGCGQSTAPTNPAPAPSHEDDDNHHRDGMMIEHAGPYHAALTSHLSAKDGNELDLFFETLRDAKPVALAVESIAAKAKRAGDDKEYDLTFLPAPAKERPKDEEAGKCSHFVAKAPFLKPTDTLTVTLKVVIRDKERTVTWEEFDVKKFHHRHD